MPEKQKTFILILIILAAACLIPIKPAFAGNAVRMLGFSARDSGMGGATTASSEDTSCLIRNPAGLIQVGNKVDIEYLNIIPHGVTMHTEGPLARQGVVQESTVTYLPGANAGISFRIPKTDKYPVVIGTGIFTMSGIALDYPSSRLNFAAVGRSAGNVYDKMVDLRSARIPTGIAVGLTDKLYVGAAGNIGIELLKTDLATTPNYHETGGSGKWDAAVGAGFTVGMLYKMFDTLSLGASYESHGWYQHFHKYKDILPFIDEPQLVNMGVSLKPTKALEVTFDARYINWTDTKLTKNGPESGGFGWQDQWVFATGAECSAFRDMLKLRIGYMYGKSPIQPHVVFANALFPVIMEHHLTMGFSAFIAKNVSIDFVWEHHFKGTQSDNGAGDVYSRDGVGTKITGAGDIIGVGIGYKF